MRNKQPAMPLTEPDAVSGTRDDRPLAVALQALHRQQSTKQAHDSGHHTGGEVHKAHQHHQPKHEVCWGGQRPRNRALHQTGEVEENGSLQQEETEQMQATG